MKNTKYQIYIAIHRIIWEDYLQSLADDDVLRSAQLLHEAGVVKALADKEKHKYLS